MRLIGCHIENFGAFSDFDIAFDPALHRVCEPNGWGKSTLAAFIRVMFFGFEGEGKRKNVTENERKRYEPWQGGVYGGQITFETGGRTYTAARVFSSNKTKDSFELRDARTNLVCDDFSENLGEEIFRINGESFVRTVFIGQNDCATRATDSINAKIGNFADSFGDLDRYEQAAAALKDAQNKLTPDRKTGLLRQLSDEITRMETETAQTDSLEAAIATCADREEEARAQLAEIRRQQEEAFALTGAVSRAQDQKAEREAYARLCGAYERAEEACRSREAQFPGEVLSEEALSDCTRACDEMNLAAGAMRGNELTMQEETELAELTSEETGRESRSGEAPRGWLAFLIGGVIALVIGLLFYLGFWRFWPWLIVAIAGAALLVAGAALGWRARRGKERREARSRERRARLAALEEKRQRYLASRAQYEEKRDYVHGQIRRMGLTPEEEPGIQLQGILRQTIELKNARRDAETARREKEAFENSHDMGALSDGASPREERSDRRPSLSAEDLPSMEELHATQQRLKDAEEETRGRADTYADRMASLREQYDTCAETQERLAEAREERTTRMAQYGQIGAALSCLTSAKETLTARYRDPLLESFSAYYRIVTGDEAAQFRMDANANLTVEAYGRQYETEYLSRGWQDLVGLCFRLALVDAMYPDEKPFLLLDDPLVSLDDEKRAGARRLLASLAERYQVICFTCRDEW